MHRYRRLLSIALCFVLLALVGQGVGQAARDTSMQPSRQGPRLEVLVFETDACTYCEIFRRDVAPGYRLAPLAATAPLRYVDVSKVDLDRIGLASRVEVLPTTVLMRNGHEVERITGLTAAETYYVLLRHMIAKNE